MAHIGEVGNRAKSIFAIVARVGVEHHIATGHARFHLQHLFGLDMQAVGHLVDLIRVQALAVRIGIADLGAHALFHRAQVEKQFALGLGGGHFDHAPVLQNVFMDFGFDPVQGIAHQAHALLGVKALDRLHQAHIAFLNQIGMGQAIAQVLARDGHHQAQV